MQYDVRIKKLKENAVVPTYGSEFAAGADLYAAVEESVTIAPSETKLIPTGIAMEIPVGYAGFIYARSGLASKKGLAPANKVGVIAEFFVALVVTYRNNACAFKGNSVMTELKFLHFFIVIYGCIPSYKKSAATVVSGKCVCVSD